MRFADEYSTMVAQAADEFAAKVGTAEAFRIAARIKLGQGSAAIINASGPNPTVNAMDLVVLASISRMVAEDHPSVEQYGDATHRLLETSRQLETNAWALVRPVLNSEQQNELRGLIQEWRRKNPNQRYVSAVRFREFAEAIGRPPQQFAGKPASVFSLLFLDPMAGLDPTLRAVEETRYLAERVLYYGQRMPNLVSWQIELLTLQLADQPAARQVLTNANQLSASLETFAKTAEQLPQIINQQREAAIQQVFAGVAAERTNILASLASEEEKMRALLAETRGALNAANEMAASLNAAIQSLDTFVRYVSPPGLAATLWAAMALYFDVRAAWLRLPLSALYLAGIVTGVIRFKSGWHKTGLATGGFLLVLGWWLLLQPSNDRGWQPDVAVLPYADLAASKITIHNIRNCDYRTETDFDVRHYDKTLDLEGLRTADLYMVYWGSPHMAHTMVSFGIEGGDYVCFSIETRKEKGEGYSAVKGLFRQFELTYVVADERDVVRLRTNYRRGEEAYLFRLRGSREQARGLFLDYLHRMNRLRERPRWYNAVTYNCTTGIRTQRAAADRAPWDWRMLVNGYGDELLYERGMIATNLPLAELKRQVHVNARARAADKDPDFSTRIRQGVPGIDR
jgi:hypothetical protein